MKIIESIPLSRTRMENSDESVKYGYQMERLYLDKEVSPTVIGPMVVTFAGKYDAHRK